MRRRFSIWAVVMKRALAEVGDRDLNPTFGRAGLAAAAAVAELDTQRQ